MHAAESHSPPGVTETLDTLDGETCRTLAALQDAPDDVAEVVIATLGYWVRVLLAKQRVIEPFDEEGVTGSDEARKRPSPVKLTDHGRQVLAACATEIGTDPDLAKTMQRLRREREQYLDAGKKQRQAGHLRDAVA